VSFGTLFSRKVLFATQCFLMSCGRIIFSQIHCFDSSELTVAPLSAMYIDSDTGRHFRVFSPKKNYICNYATQCFNIYNQSREREIWGSIFHPEDESSISSEMPMSIYQATSCHAPKIQ
jgi:hypothetical protein